jgi:hypothetical protein
MKEEIIKKLRAAWEKQMMLYKVNELLSLYIPTQEASHSDSKSTTMEHFLSQNRRNVLLLSGDSKTDKTLFCYSACKELWEKYDETGSGIVPLLIPLTGLTVDKELLHRYLKECGLTPEEVEFLQNQKIPATENVAPTSEDLKLATTIQGVDELQLLIILDGYDNLSAKHQTTETETDNKTTNIHTSMPRTI